MDRPVPTRRGCADSSRSSTRAPGLQPVRRTPSRSPVVTICSPLVLPAAPPNVAPACKFGAMRTRLLAIVVAVCTAVSAVAQAPRATAGAPARELRWGGDAEGGAPFVEADPADP